jgi:putative membrane protein
MRQLIAALTLSMMVTPALAQSAAEQSGVNSALDIPPKTQDFIREAMMSDMFEIESSKLAVQRASGPAKDFAQQMIQAHEKTSAELKQMLTEAKIEMPAPAAMSDDHQDVMKEMTDLKDDEFSAEYIDQQVDAHEDAVDLFERYAEEGENAQLKAWAAKTLPDLQHHLKMAQDLDK